MKHPDELREQVLAWMTETGNGPRKAAKKFSLPKSTIQDWRKAAWHNDRAQEGQSISRVEASQEEPLTRERAPAPEVADAGRLDRVRGRLAEVLSDIELCRDEKKVTALASLQTLASKLEAELCSLEEAADQVRARALLDADQAELVEGLLDELAELPDALVENLVAQLIARKAGPRAEA